MTTSETSSAREHLHLGVAEQGKVHALAGEHVKALLYYRQAMRMAGEAGAPALFSRHYMECALESLELMGAYDEVLASCEKAIDHYRENPPAQPLARVDLATFHERAGMILLKAGRDPKEARAHLQKATKGARAEGKSLPLAETLLRWVDSGLHVDAKRILAEQKRHKTLSVRPESVEPARAIPLPDIAGIHPGNPLR